MPDLRIGLIGCGVMGQQHARVLATMRGVALAGCYDLDHHAAGALATTYGGRAYLDSRTLLAQVDAAIIATPTSSHATYALQALEVDCPALVEKPLAANATEARAIAEADHRHIVSVGHVERFNPAFRLLARMASGHRSLAISAERISPWPARSSEVSVVLDLMVHDLDLVLALVPEVPLTAVHAVGRKVRGELVDHAYAVVSFGDGTVVSLTASRIAQRKVRTLCVHAEDITIEADLLTRTVETRRQGHDKVLEDSGYSGELQRGFYSPPAVEPLRAELEAFLGVVRAKAAPVVGAQDGAAALALALQIDMEAVECR